MAKRKRLGRVVAPALLMSLGLAPLGAQALGLGNLRVNSALGQPLSARIDLVGTTAAEAEVANVSLASPAAHERLGVVSTLGGVTLHFEVKVSGDGRPYVAVTSHQPVREPYIEFVVEAVSPAGQVARHYTVLLDPVGSPALPAPAHQWTSPVPAPASPAEQASPRPRANPYANIGAPKSGATWGPVPPGATLWSIARRVQPKGADLDDVMSAIQRANPKAFINGDPTRLLAGSRLIIPQEDTLRAPAASSPAPAEAPPTPDAPAPADIPPASTPTRAQAPAAEPTPTPPATPSAEQAKSDGNQATGEVRVLRAEDTVAGNQPAAAPVTENRIQLLEEALDAAQQQNVSLEARLKALEEQIHTLTEITTGATAPASPAENATPPAETAAAPATQASVTEAAPAAPAPAVPKAAAANARAEAAPTVTTAAAPEVKPAPAPASAQATERLTFGSRVYALAAAGAGLAGLVLWMRRRRAAMNLTQTNDHTPEAQAAQVAHEQVTDESAPTPPVADTSAETSIGSAHDGFGDPVDTQIDLLTAYVGMADGQSARQIYDEIQRVGNDAQKAQAKALLARLDA